MINNETNDAGQRRGNAAFTLTEVVVAVVLMLAAMGLLLSAFVSSRRSVVLAQSHLIAMQLASSQAERLQTNVYSNIVFTSTTITNTRIRYALSSTVVTNRISKDITIRVGWTPPDSSRPQVVTNFMTICSTN